MLFELNKIYTVQAAIIKMETLSGGVTIVTVEKKTMNLTENLNFIRKLRIRF